MSIEELKTIASILQNLGDKALLGFAMYTALAFLQAPLCWLIVGGIVLRLSKIFRTQVRHTFEIQDQTQTHVFPTKSALAEWLKQNGFEQ